MEYQGPRCFLLNLHSFPPLVLESTHPAPQARASLLCILFHFAWLYITLTPASLAAGDWLVGVPPEPRLAVVAVATSCVVAAPLTYTPASATRQPEQLRVEAAAAGMLVARAGWERDGAVL